MNNTRRKSLRKSIYYLDLAREIIDTCNDEESDYRDNMPENLQDSDKYNAADEACDAMDEAISSIDDITSAIHDIL